MDQTFQFSNCFAFLYLVTGIVVSSSTTLLVKQLLIKNACREENWSVGVKELNKLVLTDDDVRLRNGISGSEVPERVDVESLKG